MWPALGTTIALQLVAGVVRVRGWFHVIRRSAPEDTSLRYRDVAVAHLGGCGWNAVLPAHLGDAVKVALVGRTMPATPTATLVGTLVAPTLVDATLTGCLVAVLVAADVVGPSALTAHVPGATSPRVLIAATCALAVATVVFRARILRIARDTRRGLALLRSPRLIVTRVLPWHLASRGLRLLAFAVLLMAAGMPFGLVPALVLMALQGASPSVSPAATAIRIALVAGVLAGTGAGNVDGTHLATVLLSAYAVGSVTNLALSATVIAVLFRTASPRRIVGHARAALGSVRGAREAGVTAVPVPSAARVGSSAQR